MYDKKLLLTLSIASFSLMGMEENKQTSLREKRVQRLKELKARVTKTTSDLAENPYTTGQASIEFAISDTSENTIENQK